MRAHWTAGLAMAVVLLGSAAVAGPYRFTLDYYVDNAGYSIGDGTAPEFEIWDLGSRLQAGRLEFSFLTELPEAGSRANDSYQQNALLTSGDLWITIGSRDSFAPGYTKHAIAVTDHANVVQQKYPGDIWPAVTQGRLYKDAEFATATYEPYQQFMNTNNYWYTPDDQDGDDTVNSYRTMIKDFDQEIAGHSDLDWVYEPYWYWDDDTSDWLLQDAWRVTGYVEMAQIGLTPHTPYALFVASECGNDGAEHPSLVPEPVTLSLFAAAAALAGIRRRRRR